MANTIKLGDVEYQTLLSITPEEQEIGLMNIEPPTPIMTFIYNKAKINKYWMHRTPAALDILFCYNGKISQICNGIPYSTAIIGNDTLSDLVVELPAGSCQKNGINIGDNVLLKCDDANAMRVFSAIAAY